MKKFKIQIETTQVFEVETELENAEKAKELREKIYNTVRTFMEDIAERELKDAVYMSDALKFENQSTDKFNLVEFFGGDDFSDSDIIDLEAEELPEADRASLCGIYTLTLECPLCGAEIQIDDSEGRYGDIMDAINAGNPAIVTCDDCGKQFKQNSYKEY